MKSDTCCLSDYITLYNSGISVFDLNQEKLKDNKEYIAYRTKTKGNPIKLVSYKKSFKLIPYDVGIFSFYNASNLFWAIPLELMDNSIRGFILRSFKDKLYRTINFTDFSLPYGFPDFDNSFDPIKNTIVLTEGTRDAMFIKSHITPYCLSINMARLGVDLINILDKFANRFLIITDMDAPGRANAKANMDSLLKEGKIVHTPTYELKDVGDYFYATTFQQFNFINKVKSLL